MLNAYATNTLRYDAELCNNCGMCSTVCPHGVFTPNEDAAKLVRPEACMECGACQQNCPTGAITVDTGVGCAAAMIKAALTGQKEACCGPSDLGSCGPGNAPGTATSDQGGSSSVPCCGQERLAPKERPAPKEKLAPEERPSSRDPEKKKPSCCS